MVIISQNTGKQGFFVISGQNSGEIDEKFDCFMQNKANFLRSQMNVNIYNTKNYENKRNWTIGESKPNSNPIKPNQNQSPKTKMNVNLTLTKDYRKKDAFTVRINKPNFFKGPK